MNLFNSLFLLALNSPKEFKKLEQSIKLCKEILPKVARNAAETINKLVADSLEFEDGEKI